MGYNLNPLRHSDEHPELASHQILISSYQGLMFQIIKSVYFLTVLYASKNVTATSQSLLPEKQNNFNSSFQLNETKDRDIAQ